MCGRYATPMIDVCQISGCLIAGSSALTQIYAASSRLEKGKRAMMHEIHATARRQEMESDARQARLVAQLRAPASGLPSMRLTFARLPSRRCLIRC